MSSEFILNLVKNAKNGNAEAFGELYALFSKDLFRFAFYYTGSVSLAEDCVSEAICLAFENIGNLKKSEAFKSWIFKILYNCCKEAQKEKAFKGREIELSEIENLHSIEPDKAENAALWAAVKKLPEEESELIMLRYIFGYTSREIGEITGLKDNTVRSKISRAIMKLQKLLVK